MPALLAESLNSGWGFSFSGPDQAEVFAGRGVPTGKKGFFPTTSANSVREKKPPVAEGLYHPEQFCCIEGHSVVKVLI